MIGGNRLIPKIQRDREPLMSPLLRCACLILLSGLAPAALTSAVRADDTGWIDLTGAQNFDAWKPPTELWAFVGEVRLDPGNPRRLVASPGTGVLYNGSSGRTRNLVTKQNFRDVEAHVEFLIPRGSNSGVKFGGVYEIQILDSAGKKVVTGNDCGGIYPRAESKPTYHYLDDGHPPRTNAALPAGEWQTLDVTFHAPRFDASGKKVASARFVKVVLNGQLIHEDVEAATPTGSAWVKKETATGPLLIQADHGPVAIRNVRVRPLEDSAR
jgi:hypothetical protein